MGAGELMARMEPCRDCGLMMRWVATINQNRIPLDAEPNNEAGTVTVGEDGFARKWPNHAQALAAVADEMVPQTWTPHHSTCKEYGKRAHVGREEHPKLF
jgi:hypothetical protein